MLGLANRRQPPPWDQLISLQVQKHNGVSPRGLPAGNFFEPDSGGRREQREALGKGRGRGAMPTMSLHPHLMGASLAWGSPSMHQPWQGWPQALPVLPWQGPAASVHLMKPSGCDTISSKHGREPLPGSSKGKRARSDKQNHIREQAKKPLLFPPLLCFPMLYFYKRSGPRPTTFTQRSQLHIVAAVHTVLVLAAPPTLPQPLQRPTPSSSPISTSNELSTGGMGRGWLSNKKSPRPTYTPHRPWEENTHNKGIVKSRSGGPGPQTLGYCVLGPGFSPDRAQPLQEKETRLVRCC